MKFLVDEWRSSHSRQKLRDKTLYLTCEELCYKVTKDQWEEVHELKSTQEEADTRMLLHALHASEVGYKTIVISAEDTDVLILSLAFKKDISATLFQKCGTQSRTRFLDIGKIVQSVGYGVTDALLGLHAFSGCDTVSTFSGRGKLSPLKLMKGNHIYQDAFVKLGQSWELSDDLFKTIQQFTCHMYAPSTQTEQVNQL